MAAILKDKVAIVTGSSSGIGLAIAINLASKGARVTICGRDEAKLKAALAKVVKASGSHTSCKFTTVAGDLKDQQYREKIVKKTVKKFGRLDILVPNAGVSGAHQSIIDVTEENYDEVMDTNLKCVLFLIKEAIPHLEKTKGKIINITSNASAIPVGGMIAYSLSKAALEHLTNCLAVDLGAKGVRVNSVLPGYIPTSFLRDLGKNVDQVQAAIATQNALQQPLKERSLNVDDIAAAVAFLASDASGCITGEHIKVDGGRTFGGTVSF
jgi:NAD(P)-dependent dehydrogenase (short-subunit alcohol dehydrogenase family)